MACTTRDCPYIVLGVPFDISDKDLKSAFRRLMKKWHPDRNPSPDATERTKLLNLAWEKVSRPEARKEHDASCEVMREHAAHAAASAGAQARAAGGGRTHARAGHTSTAREPAGRQHPGRRWSARGTETGQQAPPKHQSRPGQQSHAEADRPPTEDDMGWDDPDFVVGHRYATHDGEAFRVLHVSGDWAYIKFADGRHVSKHRSLLWASWLEYRARRHPRAGRTTADGPGGSKDGSRTNDRAGGDSNRSGRATWTPSAADDAVLAWYDTTFVLGHWYAHEGSVYEVVGIRGDLIDVRYPDGTEVTFRRSVLRDAWMAIRRAWLSRKRVHV